MFKLIETWAAKRRAVVELSRLSDHALADLGIARTDIVAVATAAVESRHPAVGELALPHAGHRRVPAWATSAAPTTA